MISLTTGRGRTKWFLKQTGISYTPLQKMKDKARADEEIVKVVRSFLKTKEAKALIEHGETKSVS